MNDSSRRPEHNEYDAMGLGSCTVDGDGRLVEASRAMADMLGFASAAQAAGTAFDPQCLEALRAALGQSRGKPTLLETRYVRHDGSFFTARLHVRFLDGPEDGLENGHEDVTGNGLAIVAEDISEMASRFGCEAERRYRVLFDHAGDAIFLHDLSGSIIDVNRAACQRLGYSRTQLLGMNMLQLETDAYSVNLPDHMDRLDAYGELSFLSEYQRSDGSVIPTETNSRIVEMDGRRLAVSIARDMAEYVRVQEALKAHLASVEGLVAERTRELSLANERLMRETVGRKRFVEKLQSSEAKYRSLIETTDTGFVIVNQKGLVLDANDGYVELAGRKGREEVVGHDIEEWVAEHDRKRLLEAMSQCCSLGAIRDFQVEYELPDGRLRPVEINASEVDVLGHKQIHALCRDITSRREAEREIKILNRAVEQSPASVVITNPDGHIKYVNAKFTEVTGYAPEEVIGKRPSILKSGRLDDDFYKEMWQTISSGREWRGEFCNLNKAGEIFWESSSISPIFDASGKIVHYVAVKEDITERKEQQDRIRRLALHDALTGLPNRTLLMDRLSQAIARSARTGVKVAVLFIDLNKFKPINDTFGHQTGDEVLKDAAGRIAESVRQVDTTARMGGDEFVALLQDIGELAEVEMVARRIIERIDMPYHHCAGGVCPQVGASVGIALCPEHGMDIDTLISRADQAMYRVKETGGSGFAYWEESV